MQNLKGHVNVLTLRSEKELEGVDEKKNESKESEKTQPTCEFLEEEKEKTYVPSPSYKPHIPFPQRSAKAKIKKHFKKFVEIFKNVYINIPFIEELFQISYYTQFFKNIISNKQKLEDTETIMLT